MADEVKPAYMAWDRRMGDYDNYLQKMVEIFKETTKGISAVHIEHIAQKVIEQKGERVYQFTRKEIERHRSQGHLLIAISGSPEPLVKEMAEKYKFDGLPWYTISKGCTGSLYRRSCSYVG